MAHSHNIVPDIARLSRGRAKCILVLTLLVSVRSAGLGQQPCTVPVTVRAFELSSFPKEYVDRAIAWRQKTRGQRLGKPGQLEMGEFGFAMTELWTVARDVPAEAFVARDGKGPVAILSVQVDHGPRRIVFVGDNGTNLSVEARKIESTVLADIVSRARPQDDLALLLAPGLSVELPFGASREAIQAAAEGLANPPRGKPGRKGVVDAILKATSWLQPPQRGDSIFLLTMGVDAKHQASLKQVRRALAASRTRVFGFQLEGPRWNANLFPEGGPTGFFFGPAGLSKATGGVFVPTRTMAYALTDSRQQQLTQSAEQIYSAITDYYALELSSVSSHLRISLSPEFQNRLLVPMDVLYPRHLPPCSNVSRIPGGAP